MTNPKLALIPSGYKGGSTPKVYSILPNDGSGDFTFDRDTVATRVRKDGLIEEVAADIPRLDWFNSNCPNLLLEPSRTNLAHYSEQIDNAYWNKTGLSVTANQITSPDGTLTADKLQRTSTSSSFVSKAFTKTASEVQNFSLSVFVKKGDSRYATLALQGDYPDRAYLQYDFEQGTINASIDFVDFTILSTKAENYNNGWVRLSFAVSTDAHSSITVLISPKNDVVTTALTDSSDSCFMYVWGIQLEKDTYSTSYIKTEASSGTRNADVCTDAGDVNVFNSLEGVLYAEISVLSDDLTNREISLNDGTTANRVSLFYQGASNRIRAEIKKDTNVTIFNSFTTNYDVKNINKIAIKYKSSDYSFYINGTKIGSSTTTNSFNANTLNTLDFRRPIHSSTIFYGRCKDLRYYDTALTDAQLTELTT
jgi:hypothetical protein